MIFLWFKIIYYKMIKAFRSAEAGTDTTVPRARHEAEISGEIRVGLDPSARDGLVLYSTDPDNRVRMNTARLNELIGKGLVYAPDPDGDMRRVEIFEADRAQREFMELESGYPGACPCGGRHYPSPYSCRWCKCHDPRNEHHRPDALGLMQVIKPGNHMSLDRGELEITMPLNKLMDVRPSAEIVSCDRCGHPQHPTGSGPCAGSVPSGDPSGGVEPCLCPGPLREQP